MKESWHARRIEEAEEFWKRERLDPAAAFHTVRCTEISDSKRLRLEVDVAVEERIALFLDGVKVADLFCLPSQLEELAVGHLVCEGHLGGIEDLVSARVDGKEIVCEGRSKVIKREARPTVSDLRISPEAVFRAFDEINEGALLWRRTGGTHSALVVGEDGAIRSFCEDVSRSSAVDKAVGSALMGGADPSRSALITTGRLSSAIVSKAAMAGVPVLVSRAGPLNSGIELAVRLGMTLAAFARRPNLYVYAGEERLL
ncbi:formate dehydrogenase accessory sulfurtransferase FdhD [Methanotrichaceae archaeon M04Ac]|uniref:Protein FdhD n=1 Tax=Candidatus Methanocrinis alkalitolerans TaxID=3033395 RepID=A0ABT5XG15_9EURY|nr:formate dehydrogenase accessory sulfurtransferase FdhD [Candidatus Methanocrinis alkalitolerans]MCR3883149.1 formate dehydrogenase accessory sulfurtransferase FdhD [Methanothrix sp.]MDF0593636.1 formate dehydrogenase accessory sulfurtransferase FdhD [Candidatus Methanocrinis alkalitolerans]